MKCTILGAGSGLPHPEYNLSALVVETGYGCFLADCGEGTAKQLIRHNYNKDVLDAIIITHYHPDHVGGLFMVLQMLYLEGRKKALKLFLPEQPQAILDILHLFYTFEQRFSFKLDVFDMQELAQHYPNVKALGNDHLQGYRNVIAKSNFPNQMKAFSLEFEENSKRFIYTSDLGTFHNIESNLETADMIIMDALHPKAELIISFARSYRNRLILTHGISPGLKSWLDNNQTKNVMLAQENLPYVL